MESIWSLYRVYMEREGGVGFVSWSCQPAVNARGRFPGVLILPPFNFEFTIWIGCLRNNGWRNTIDKITKKAIRFSLLRTLDLFFKTLSPPPHSYPPPSPLHGHQAQSESTWPPPRSQLPCQCQPSLAPILHQIFLFRDFIF